MKKFRKVCVALMCAPLLLIASVVNAGHPAEDLVTGLTEKMISNLQSPEAKANPKIIDGYVQTDVLPHIDFTLMTKLAVGSKNWKAIDAEQRSSLVSEFRTLLLNTYTKALGEYSGQKLEFLPYEEAERADRAVVKSLFVDGGGVKIPIDYKLRNKNNEGWKIYDIVVENISLVLGYRSEFSAQIAKGGVDGLIDVLRKKNAS